MLTSKFPIVLAPTGMVPTRQLTPHVPLTPMEIAEDVARCAEIGITSVHLHARDDNGHPDWHREIYAAIIYEVKSRTPDVLINVSTSGRNWSEIEKRADCLSLEGDLKPDLASLTLSSLNFLSGPSINSPEDIYKLASIMLERGITPELELFDLGMVNMVRVLKKKNLLPSTLVVNLFVGNIAGAQATLGELGVLVDRLPEGTIWSGAGIGEYRDRAHALSLAAGGGVRVGLEDGIYLNSRRNVLATNPSLVERVHNMASLLDLEMLKSSELRKLIRSG
jgi:3-keto-5-aminohexanoate cleavage enzyme